MWSGTVDTTTWQRIEGAVVFLAGAALFVTLDDGIAWWLAILLFFCPDVSFAAYAVGPRTGAFVYNAVHVFAFGAVLLAAGLATGSTFISALGALWLGHSGFDRMLGYGLKSPDGFNLTHLGPIGRSAGR